MSSSPLVSIVFPVYNSEYFLNYSIESIISQTYKNWELLLVYDKSNDNSLAIIKAFIDNDKRIKLLYNNKKGLIGALNLGIKVSKGDYIVRMDSDDISLPDRIKSQVKYMLTKNLDICGCNYYVINKKGVIIKTNYVPLSHINCFIKMFSAVPFAHPTVIIKKDFLKEHNLFYGINSEIIAEDLEMWIKMFNSGAKFGNLNQILFKYRVFNNSLSRQNKTRLLKQSLVLYNKFFEQNLKRINFLFDNKVEFNTKVDIYYYYRLLVRYIFKKSKFGLVKNFNVIDVLIIIKAILAEFKNLFIFKMIIKINKY
jgi:glycosyltransferase involved in cell wall biosynthesis